VWKAGYGGLHRRKFGLSQAYVRKYIERKNKYFGFHPQPERWGLPADKLKSATVKHLIFSCGGV